MNGLEIVAVILALQFAAFGWRINREITVGDARRKAWIPLADIANIVMILATAGFCIIYPVVVGSFGDVSRPVLLVAVTMIAFHPITTAGHYGLLLGRGRDAYRTPSGDYPHSTAEERVVFVVSIVVAAVLAALA